MNELKISESDLRKMINQSFAKRGLGFSVVRAKPITVWFESNGLIELKECLDWITPGNKKDFFRYQNGICLVQTKVGSIKAVPFRYCVDRINSILCYHVFEPIKPGFKTLVSRQTVDSLPNDAYVEIHRTNHMGAVTCERCFAKNVNWANVRSFVYLLDSRNGWHDLACREPSQNGYYVLLRDEGPLFVHTGELDPNDWALYGVTHYKKV